MTYEEKVAWLRRYWQALRDEARLRDRIKAVPQQMISDTAKQIFSRIGIRYDDWEFQVDGQISMEAMQNENGVNENCPIYKQGCGRYCEPKDLMDWLQQPAEEDT